MFAGASPSPLWMFSAWFLVAFNGLDSSVFSFLSLVTVVLHVFFYERILSSLVGLAPRITIGPTISHRLPFRNLILSSIANLGQHLHKLIALLLPSFFAKFLPIHDQIQADLCKASPKSDNLLIF